MVFLTLAGIGLGGNTYDVVECKVLGLKLPVNDNENTFKYFCSSQHLSVRTLSELATINLSSVRHK